jgi:hypothetical protein
MSIIERIFNRGQRSGREIIDITPYEAGMTPVQRRNFELAFKEKVGRLSQTSQEYLAEGLRAMMVGVGKKLENQSVALVIEASGRREAVNEFLPHVPTVIKGGRVNPQTVEGVISTLDKSLEGNLKAARDIQNQRLQVLNSAIQDPPKETQKGVTIEGRGRTSKITQTENSKPILPKHINTGGIDIEYPSATVKGGASASVGDASAKVDHRNDGFSVHASSHGNSASAASGESVQINGGSIHIDPMDVDY